MDSKDSTFQQPPESDSKEPESKAQDGRWALGTFFYCIKELVSVMFQLFCFSRVASYDMTNGALVLFLTLVSFDYPFLSPTFFLSMRFGPWLRADAVIPFLMTVLQSVCIVGFQCLGAYFAALCVKDFNAANFNATNGVGLVQSNSTFQGVTYNSAGISGGFIFAEEMVATTVLQIGLYHLLEAGFMSFLNIKTSNKTSKPEATIPLIMITSASILIAAGARAFPSAHQALQITVFLAVLDSNTPHIAEHVGGAIVGMLLAILYYHIAFTWRSTMNEFVNNYILSFIGTNPAEKRTPMPAFMHSKILKSEFSRLR